MSGDKNKDHMIVNEPDRLLSLFLVIGEMVLQSGGKVSRVEHTLEGLLMAYGFARADVFTITSEIQVTAHTADGRVCSQIRRIDRWGTNLIVLEDLDHLCREICRRLPDCDEIEAMIGKLRGAQEELQQTRRYKVITFLGAVLAVSGFTLFFGGNILDAIVAAPLACLITYMTRHSRWRSSNQLLIYFIFALVTGLTGGVIVGFFAGFGIALNLDKICIGCIMLTIPGIAITNAVRDMILGETITGLFRLLQSLLIAMSIASGFIAAYACIYML